MQAGMRINAEQVSKKAMREPIALLFKVSQIKNGKVNCISATEEENKRI
jgi:hypothetical protein